MKKVVSGLTGIVLGFVGVVGIGCKSTINEEVNAVIYHSNEIRKIFELKPEETCQIVDLQVKKGEPFSVIIKGENEDKIIAYYDENKDGEYDKKTTLTVPHKLDILGIIPSKPKEFKEAPEYESKKEGKLRI